MLKAREEQGVQNQYGLLEFEFKGPELVPAISLGLIGTILSRVRRLLTYAMEKAIDPKGLHPGSQRSAVEFIRRCPVSVPQEVSAVRVFLATTSDEASQLELFPGTEFAQYPVSTRMALELLEALEEIAAPALYYDEVLQRELAKKMGHRYLSAVFSMLKALPSADVVVSWVEEAHRLNKKDSSSVKKVVLTGEARRHAEIVSTVATAGREVALQLRTVTGWVVELRHDARHLDGEGYVIGVITTRPQAGLRVSTSVDSKGYRRAIEAHASGDEVELSGLLDRSGDRWVLHEGEVTRVIPAMRLRD